MIQPLNLRNTTGMWVVAEGEIIIMLLSAIGNRPLGKTKGTIMEGI